MVTKPIKRLVSLFTSLILIVGMIAYLPTFEASAATANEMINVAKNEVGYLEATYSNGSFYSKYGDWYGLPNSPWCAMFVSWCANQAGIGTDVIPKFASCGVGADWFKNRGRWISGSSTPQPGDIVFLYGYAHVGIVESVSGNTFVSIEGNTHDGSGYNYGVRRVTHTVGNSVDGFGRPNYSSTPSDTTPPTIISANVESCNVGSLGFVVSGKASDESGLSKASFAVWTENNGQDDIKWTDASVDSSDVAYAVINLSDHNYEYGKYIVHAYFYDNAGNYSMQQCTIDIQKKNIHQDVGQTIKDGTYMLHNGANYWLDVRDAGTSNGTHMQNCNYNGSTAQQFKFVYQGNGNYLIYPVNANGKVLDILRGANWSDTLDDGDIVDIYDPGDDDAQLFKVIPVGDGKYALELASMPNHVIGGLHNYNRSDLYLQRYTNYSHSCQWEICDLSGNKIDVCNHNYSLTSTKDATCTADGSKTYTCSVCGATKTETVKATGHSYTTTVVKPTCTAQGYTLHKCSKCGNSYKDTYTAVTSHSYKLTSTKDATCTADGSKTYTCSVCGATKTETVKATGHSYTTTVVKPTTTSQGYTLHKCSKCGSSYKDNYTSALTVGTPKNFKMLLTSATTITLGWDKVDGAEGYIIEELSSSGSWTRVAKITSGSTVTYKFRNLESGLTHNYRIKAYKGSSHGSYSSTITAITKTAKVVGKMSSNSATSITLSWDKSTGASGYIIEEYVGNGEWTRVAKISDGTKTQYKISDLKSGTTHKYRIKSYKFLGKTAYMGAYSDTITAVTKPSQVKATVKATTTSSVTLSWSKVTGAEGYIIEKYVGNGNWTRVGKVTSGSTTQYAVTGLSSKTKYSFRVKAYNSLNSKAYFGAYSATVSSTTK